MPQGGGDESGGWERGLPWCTCIVESGARGHTQAPREWKDSSVQGAAWPACSGDSVPTTASEEAAGPCPQPPHRQAIGTLDGQLPPAEGAGSLGPTVAKRSCITHLHPQPACGHPQVGPLQAPGPAQVRPHPPPLTTRGRPHAMPSRLCGSRGEWARAPAPLPVTSGILSARLAPSPPCHRPTPICCAFLGDV